MEVSPRTNLKSQRENQKHGLIKKEKKKFAPILIEEAMQTA